VASLLLLLFAAAVTVRADLRRTDGDGWIAAGRALSLLAVLLYSLLQYPWHMPVLGTLVWLVLGSLPAPPASRLDARLARSGPYLALGAFALLPWHVLTTTPLEAAGNRSYGFHRLETYQGQRYEWTERYAARRVTCFGLMDDVLVLDLATGQPGARKRPVHVRVALDHRPLAELDVRGMFKTVRLPARGACRDGWALLELDVAPTVRPFSDPRNDGPDGPTPDERELGVAVRDIHFEAAR
jgi:hypothetical protein